MSFWQRRNEAGSLEFKSSVIGKHADVRVVRSLRPNKFLSFNVNFGGNFEALASYLPCFTELGLSVGTSVKSKNRTEKYTEIAAKSWRPFLINSYLPILCTDELAWLQTT